MHTHLRVRDSVNTTTEVDERFNAVDFLVTGGALRRLRMSAVFCPFRQMIAWLEAIGVGLNRCSWEWDNEGPEYCLEWNGNQLVLWEVSSDQPEEVRVRLARDQLVAAIYTAFQRLVQSPTYGPASENIGCSTRAQRSTLCDRVLSARERTARHAGTA